MRVFSILLFVLAFTFTTAVEAKDIKGTARVIDGDTLWLGNVKIRLNGIDAPERGQARFREATNALQRLVAGQTVLCRLNGDKTYDRWVAVCYVGKTDLAAAVIATGNALDCRRYSGGRYRKFETGDARRFIRQAKYC
jgi:endonuclease YncB( thermonuclease family)